mgnify:FL=1
MFLTLVGSIQLCIKRFFRLCPLSDPADLPTFHCEACGCHQGSVGIMSDDEDKLALVGEEPQRRFFVDSCVFYLVDEDDRAVTDAGKVGDHKCPGLAAA